MTGFSSSLPTTASLSRFICPTKERLDLRSAASFSLRSRSAASCISTTASRRAASASSVASMAARFSAISRASLVAISRSSSVSSRGACFSTSTSSLSPPPHEVITPSHAAFMTVRTGAKDGSQSGWSSAGAAARGLQSSGSWPTASRKGSASSKSTGSTSYGSSGPMSSKGSSEVILSVKVPSTPGRFVHGTSTCGGLTCSPNDSPAVGSASFFLASCVDLPMGRSRKGPSRTKVPEVSMESGMRSILDARRMTRPARTPCGAAPAVPWSRRAAS
mmetsp:Transcript_20511/g.64804  ORF Transcript_20511/g.64804 Transcript_20511/m.64804 type:complete len:276 (-) Transcript_20511:755-1582(-)